MTKTKTKIEMTIPAELIGGELGYGEHACGWEEERHRLEDFLVMMIKNYSYSPNRCHGDDGGKDDDDDDVEDDEEEDKLGQ